MYSLSSSTSKKTHLCHLCHDRSRCSQKPAQDCCPISEDDSNQSHVRSDLAFLCACGGRLCQAGSWLICVAGPLASPCRCHMAALGNGQSIKFRCAVRSILFDWVVQRCKIAVRSAAASMHCVKTYTKDCTMHSDGSKTCGVSQEMRVPVPDASCVQKDPMHAPEHILIFVKSKWC